MAPVQWKQLSRNISGSGHFTGSFSTSGSLSTTGSLEVAGTTTLKSNDVDEQTLTVEGQMQILKRQIGAEVRKAKLQIENLGSLGDKDEDNVMDLGGFF